MTKKIEHHFYIDESGNTGANLFDDDQPMLHYGVLCSKFDLDIEAKELIIKARATLGVKRLHAAEIGFTGLEKIAPYLFEIEKLFKPDFGLYRVTKRDHAFMCFFDQIFDQGINPAVTWTGYWTPLRYILLFKLAYLFDLDILKDAWAARIELDDNKAKTLLIHVCDTLIGRIDELPDERPRILITDALKWARENWEELNYNCHSEEEILSVTPNIVGFQSVMLGIAKRIGCPDAPAKIIVDRQSQFNQAQKVLAQFYQNGRDRCPIWEIGPGLPTFDLSNIPKAPIEIQSSSQSFGLELVDIYLWLGKRVVEGTRLTGVLRDLLSLRVSTIDEFEVSLSALHEKWTPFFKNLPALSPEQEQRGRKMIQLEEERRHNAIKNHQQKTSYRKKNTDLQ